MKDLFTDTPSVPNQLIFETEKAALYLKREDLLHPEISGNKYRKLKYNLLEARKQKKEQILTFGGAFSNHIAATAAAGREFGFKSIGVIRGEELGQDLQKTLQENTTLSFAASCGMEFDFVSREAYRQKNSEGFLENLRNKYGDFYLIPEGGTNALAIKGCEEILSEEDGGFDVICCAVGTGGSISGLINSSEEHQKVLGFPALKGDFLHEEIRNYTSKFNWELILDYHFGGYAKVNRELIEFLNTFKRDYGIQLDPVYTGKMMYGIFDLLRNGYFLKNTRILAVHTGGLQGIPAMNAVLTKKNLPLIQ